MDNLADWYRGSMAPPMVAGAGLIPRPIPSANGSTVAKTYTSRLGQDVPSSSAALALNGMFGRGMPETAMAFAPSAGTVPMPRPRPGSAPNAMDLAAMADSSGRGRKTKVLGTPIPAQQAGGLYGLLQSLFTPQKSAEGGLLGLLSGNGQRITAPGGGGAFIARAGSPAESAGAGSGALLPSSMNSTRWTSGY